MALCVASCSTSDQPKPSHIAVKCEKDGRWSMINQNGEFLFQDEFENQPTSVVNGVFVVKEGETHSIYEAVEKPKVIAEGFQEVGMLNENLMPTVKDAERISIINKKGEQVFVLNPHNGKEIVACTPNFSDGLLSVKDEDGKWGYVNKKGEMVITPKYDSYSPFSDGLALVSKSEKDGNSSVLVIDKNAEVKMELKLKKFELQSPFKNGLAVVEDKDKDRIGFIDLKGEFKKVPKKVRRINDYDNNVFTYTDENGKWGVMGLDENNTEYIRAKYSNIQIISSDKFLVKDDKEYVILNKEGNKILDFGDDYEQVDLFGSNFIVKEGDIYMILDGENKPVNKNEYYKINDKATKFEVINSYYFDVDGVSQVIADCISDKGIDKYTLGEPTSKYLEEYDGNIENYAWKNAYSDESNSKKGYKYSIDFGFVSYDALVRSEWGSNWKYIYTINPDAKIESISLSANVDKYGEQVKAKLISLLEKKGWKNNNGTLVSNGKVLDISMNSNYGGDIVKVRMSKDLSFIEPGAAAADISTSDVAGASNGNEINMIGKLNGKTEVKMVLDNAFNGFLYYTKNGYNTDIKVNGSLDGNQLTLKEFVDGKNTGTYNGVYDGKTYVGTFIRANDNKQFTFSLVVE